MSYLRGWMTGLAALTLFLPLAGCGSRVTENVVNVADDDAEMNAAIKRSRENVQTFITALQHPKSGQDRFSVKLPVQEDGLTEHMWLTPVRWENGTFTGTLNNQPERLVKVKLGDTLTAKPEQISDWMFVENGKLVGGYSIRLLRDRATPAERRELDAGLGFRIE